MSWASELLVIAYLSPLPSWALMGLFNCPGFIVTENLESKKDVSLFGGCLWWFWYPREQKIESLIGYIYGNLVDGVLFDFSFAFSHSLSFHSLLVGILMNVIFKSPFGKISLLNKALFSRLAPYIPNANPE